jgi:hypothetical protein
VVQAILDEGEVVGPEASSACRRATDVEMVRTAVRIAVQGSPAAG